MSTQKNISLHTQAAIKTASDNNIPIADYVCSMLSILGHSVSSETVIATANEAHVNLKNRDGLISYEFESEMCDADIHSFLDFVFSHPDFESYFQASSIEEAEENLSENFDLFSMYWLLPDSVQDIYEESGNMENDGVDTYEICAFLENALSPLGYAFDYGLDGVPFNLRKIGAASV